jgi:hypothetical protein
VIATGQSGGKCIQELELVSRLWQFGRGNGTVICPQMRLIRGGEISPRQHHNESSWRVHDNALEFLNSKGAVTCRFDDLSIGEQGTMTLKGRFKLIPGVVHVLQEVRLLTRSGPANNDPRVALLVRTHLVNEKLFDLLDLLNQSRRYDLFVSADETSGTLDLGGFAKLPHTTRSCVEHGLCSDHEQILWHCGDYPLYFAAAEKPDYDYYAMIEYDVDLVRRSPLFIEGLISRLEDADFVVAGGYHAHADWPWAKSAAKRFSVVYSTGLFAFLIVSRRALEYLLEARRSEARNGAAERQSCIAKLSVPRP